MPAAALVLRPGIVPHLAVVMLGAGGVFFRPAEIAHIAHAKNPGFAAVVNAVPAAMFLGATLRFSSGRFDDFVGIAVGVIHRRSVLGTRRVMMAALLFLDALAFGLVELVLALHRVLLISILSNRNVASARPVPRLIASE